jgi:hypothetical protein
MATKEDTLYVRNGKPNRTVFHFNNVRYLLEHRGNRADSVSVPIEALSDPLISRWLKNGQLERISKESFMRLNARKVDVLPNTYLKRHEMRSGNAWGVPMEHADADATRSKTQIPDKEVHKTVREKLTPQWAGDLMSTEEELETLDLTQEHLSYPSKHRDDSERRQMGY